MALDAQAILEEMEERVQRGDPTPGAYSGGEPEPEVSHVGQAELAALAGLFQQMIAYINAKQGADNAQNAANADSQALDNNQAGFHHQTMTDLTYARRYADPQHDMRLRHAEDLHSARVSQQEQGFQQTMRWGDKALENAVTLQAAVQAAMVKDLLAETGASRLATDRSWTTDSGGFEVSALQSLSDVLVEAVRNTPLQPDKNQAVPQPAA